MKANCLYAILIGVAFLACAVTAQQVDAGEDDPQANESNGLEETVESYTSSIAREPGNAVYYNNLATLHYKAGRYEEAIATLRRAIDIESTAMFNLNLSISLETVGRDSEALETALAAMELEPKNKRVRQQVCGLHYRLKQFEMAITCYETDPSIGENDLLAKGYYAASHVASDPEKAIKIAKEIIAEQPLFAGAHNVLGTAQFLRKKYKEAVVSYRRAVELAPNVVAFRYNFGVAQMVTQNKAGALSQYKMIKGKNEKLAKALYRYIFSDSIVMAPPPIAPEKP